MKSNQQMLKLKMRRLEKGLTQTELAEKVGVSMMSISNYESGSRFPRRAILDKIADVLGCTVADLI